MTYKVSGTSMILGTLCLMFGAAPSFAGPPNNDVSDAGRNTAGGSSALFNNTTGVDNTAFGFLALANNTAGSSNTAFGKSALRFNTNSFNTAVGVAALGLNTTGSSNTANGYSALLHNTTGGANTANGLQALFSNTTGGFNTANGFVALKFNTSGSGNTANGDNALSSNTIGDSNTANGDLALTSNTTGNGNIALGRGAGSELTTGNDNIDIGNIGVIGESRIIRIGAVQKATFIAGIRGSVVPGGVGVIAGLDGRLGTVSSSARFKEAIKPMGQRRKQPSKQNSASETGSLSAAVPTPLPPRPFVPTRVERDEVMAIASRVARLNVSHKSPERFFEDKSQLAYEIRQIAERRTRDSDAREAERQLRVP